MAARIWLDVEDIFEYAALNPRLSGIQRVQIEVGRALAALDPAGERVGFVKHVPGGSEFRVISWASVAALAERLEKAQSDAPSAAPEEPEDRPQDWRPGPVRRAFRRQILRMGTRRRHHFVMSVVHQRAALASLRAFFRESDDNAASGGAAAPAQDAVADGQPFRAVARPGDVVVTMGAIWYHPDYADLIRRNCHDLGLRFAVLIYDLIPVLRPEWVDEGNARSFYNWFIGTIGLADHVLAISRATAHDVERYAARQGIALRSRAETIPMGTGFSTGLARLSAEEAAASAGARALPEPGSYVLMVSTMEARKNHVLLFHVWRRMVDELPPDEVPTLVFAGGVGWMVEDLMLQLRRCSFLGGKVVLVRNPTDAELRRLYDGCLFTVYPSFFEGWGLPVSESFGFGRPAVISNATSLPEAGGDLARYFDPYCVTDAYAAIRRTLADRVDLAAWREQVQREFRPVPWTETAEAVLRHLGAGA